MEPPKIGQPGSRSEIMVDEVFLTAVSCDDVGRFPQF